MVGSELPAEVDRVLQTEVEPGATDRGMHVGGVADEQDAAVAEPVGHTGVAAGYPA